MSMICPYCNGLPCTCGTSRTIISAAQSPQPCRHGIFSHRVCETCKETAQLESELAALRSQLAELQRKLGEYDRRIVGVGEVAINSVSRDAYDGAREDAAIWKKRALEAESKLDEQAKQEPVAWAFEEENGSLYGLALHDHGGIPLYRLPPNLPAMIEQARAEEREACAKEIERAGKHVGWHHAAKDWPTDSRVAIEIFSEHQAAAIRARGEKT